ncbi:MAG: polyprenol monophosphomannose synthase [Chloroflexi bacterium]|nr:polyprenol monophosphomannose synthase [Chloroflexota bacterium]
MSSVEGKVVIVVPTYIEAENLPRLAERIFALDMPKSSMIVVDDASPDGTSNVARKLRRRYNGRVVVIEREDKLGLGTAYVRGFSQALEDGAEYVVQMDADLSHAPEYIPGFIEALGTADVVIGSRYAEGGGVDKDWTLKRRLLSSLANLGIRAVSGVKVKDATTGFKAFRATSLVSLNLEGFHCKGFGFQAEVAYACQEMGHKIVERPIVFHDRAAGKSKMSLGIIIEAMWKLAVIRWRR